MYIENCVITALPQKSDYRGNLTFLENINHVPFNVKRIFYMYDVPLQTSRGGHAHFEQHQFLISLHGSFEVFVDDYKEKKQVVLDSPAEGLYVPPLIWVDVKNFTDGAVCLVLTSDLYDESDYIRNYQKFSEVKSIV